jgi:WD40-like Beta Propeller Repeat
VPVTQAELATVTSHHRLTLRLPGTDPSVFQLSVAGSGLRGRLECLPVTQEAAGSSPVAPDKFCRMTQGGEPTKLSYVVDSAIAWMPDSKAVMYVDNRNGVSNLWSQTLDGRPPKQLTNFTSGSIFNFVWSRDGEQMFLARGAVNSDVVLISNVK